VRVFLRPFHFNDEARPARSITVKFGDSRVVHLAETAGDEVALARLDPPVIGSIFPSHGEDRLIIAPADTPELLTETLKTVEDRNFDDHRGFDLVGIARALWVNLSAGEIRQGGSTLTQQLVKNFFLTAERTLERKATELVMAVLLEAHYSKEEILETYLNEIYLGQDKDRAIHGIGLAAQFYFGKEVRHLTLAESALLVGIIKGPAHYDPHRHPSRALERRNLVLRETKEEGAVTLEQYAAARATSLAVSPKPSLGTSPYPAFVQLVHRQLRRDYDEKDLRTEGLRIFTTLDPQVQRAAEEALQKRLAQFDKDQRFGAPALEGAVVVTDPQSGEVQALVGGRDPRFRGYNRAVDAVRPVGSLLKPAIYLTALSEPS
ncbi:MAG: transglycosylase domain-containing protein, partial [Burkholderiales bacterium]